MPAVPGPVARALAAIEAATTAVDTAPTLPARFALLLRPEQDPVEKRREIETGLAPLGARVRPLSPQENRILVAEFPTRVFGVDEAGAFAAAYALADAFDLESAEPDLPTNFFPQPPRSLATKEPVEEGLGFPLDCWAPAQPELNDKPRWALTSMRVDQAWAYSEQRQRPDRGVDIIIAQPDTGVTPHPELADVVRVAPRDVLDDDEDPTDPLISDGLLGNPGHGTETASVVVSPETLTVVGTAPKATHMPIRAIESVIRLSQITVAAGIEWAVHHGAHVISMSLGGIPSFSLHRAVRRAVAADVLVVAAAGNCVKLVVWPARYDDCIAVAGTDVDDHEWRGTCRGAAVAVSAPGQNVIRASAVLGEPPSVGQGQGTSFAVALTAGVAALWLAHHGRANLIAAARARGETLQAMFRRLIRATARRPAEWDAFSMGAGIIDARALLEADLDAGRDRESAPQPDDAAARDTIAVQSLVLEAAGPGAIPPDLDWRRYGPEIAAAVLRRQLSGLGPQPELARATSLSPELASVVRGSALGEYLGVTPAAGQP